MDLVEVILFQNKKPVNENINQILPKNLMIALYVLFIWDEKY